MGGTRSIATTAARNAPVHPATPHDRPWPVLVLPCAGGWLAQCLPHDRRARGPTPSGAVTRLRRAVAAEVEARRRAGLPGPEHAAPAPQWYLTRWQALGPQGAGEVRIACDVLSGGDRRAA